MLRGQALDFGHVDDLALNPSAKAERVEHAECNRRAGQALGRQLLDLAPSRQW